MHPIDSVYVFGPIHIHGEDYLPVYKRLVRACEPLVDEVIGTWPDFWDTEEAPRAFYDRTVETITDCDLFLAEVTDPSLGVGMELQMAQHHGIPVVALAQDGVAISTMVTGLPVRERTIRYTDQDDLVAAVEGLLADAAAER